jgi:hypothetical protein
MSDVILQLPHQARNLRSARKPLTARTEGMPFSVLPLFLTRLDKDLRLEAICKQTVQLDCVGIIDVTDKVEHDQTLPAAVVTIGNPFVGNRCASKFCMAGKVSSYPFSKPLRFPSF